MANRKWQKANAIFLIFALCHLPSAICHAADLGTISGFVKFPGETPQRDMFANASDADCPRGIGQNHLLVKQETLGLQNVLIVLGRRDRRVMPTRLQSELALSGCQMVPRIQWAPLGTSLILVSRDNARHHLHAYRGNNTVFEADISPDTPPARRPLVIPGLYRINCDRHLWERAWIYVSAHDSVALTDAQGRFTIKNVPVGLYRLRAWHEGWQKKSGSRDGRLEFVPIQDSREISVRENENTEVLFDTLTSPHEDTPAN